MLSNIPLAARGPTQIIIFDIHALQERFYFTDQVIPRYVTVFYLTWFKNFSGFTAIAAFVVDVHLVWKYVAGLAAICVYLNYYSYKFFAVICTF